MPSIKEFPSDVEPVPNLPNYFFSKAERRYYSPDGIPISSSELRGVLDSFITKQTDVMEDISRALISGDLSLADWENQMLDLIKEVNLTGSAIESGGWYQMDFSDFGFAGSKIRGEYGYLRDFAGQIADGTQPLDGTLWRRARLYGEQGRVTYYDAAAKRAKDDEFNEERSFTTPADHCDLCVSEESKKWVKIGSLIPIGARTCVSNCKCFMKYRKRDGLRTIERII